MRHYKIQKQCVKIRRWGVKLSSTRISEDFFRRIPGNTCTKKTLSCLIRDRRCKTSYHLYLLPRAVSLGADHPAVVAHSRHHHQIWSQGSSHLGAHKFTTQLPNLQTRCVWTRRTQWSTKSSSRTKWEWRISKKGEECRVWWSRLTWLI